VTNSATLQDIRRTPLILQELLGRADEIAAFGRDHLSPDPGGRLYAFGCGDGLVAAKAVQGSALAACTALDMLAFTAPELDRRDRVLAISMSGNVDRGLEAARAALANAGGVLLLTNAEGGQLGGLGLPRLSLGIPPIKPFLCGTSTYTATLFALLMLGGETAIPALRAVVAMLPSIIDGAQERLARIGSDLPGVRFLGAGRAMASAALGAAKLVEVTLLPTWFGDVEEFAHSQFWSARQGELIVYLSANPLVAEVATHSAVMLNGMGFVTLAIETENAPVPTAAHRLQMPAISERLSSLAFAPVLQVLAWYLARATGLDPDTRAHLRDDTLRFATSRGLTRRALVGTGH
jgi:glucosamine 6-phosphate synthetase-like amidotransferase/phosphosugar isomerase protein